MAALYQNQHIPAGDLAKSVKGTMARFTRNALLATLVSTTLTACNFFEIETNPSDPDAVTAPIGSGGSSQSPSPITIPTPIPGTDPVTTPAPTPGTDPVTMPAPTPGTDPVAMPPAPAPAPGGGGAIDSVSAFQTTVYPIVTKYCTACHSGAGPGSPNFAHPDLATAHAAVVDNQKVNLANPVASRLVQRLTTDFHFCWSNCAQDGETMRLAIAEWATLSMPAPGTAPAPAPGAGAPVPGMMLQTAAVTLAQATEAAGAKRYEMGTIAKWEFLAGQGETAFDTSGVAPAIDLTLSGTEWISGGGINVVSGKAAGTVDASKKLFDLIADPATGSGEYTVEAWIVPENVVQNGPARIISYSLDTGARNFTVGQVAYQYDFRNRNQNTSANGTPSLATAAADEDVQTQLQHVVMTYDAVNGRKIFVNGVNTGDVDGTAVAALNWNAGYNVVMGNENTDNRLWKGKIIFAAVFNKALNDQQVGQNFNAGAGKVTLVLKFDVSNLVNMPGSYVQTEVQELDGFSYVFGEPTLVSPAAAGIPVKNIRIMVNETIPVAGQAFRNVDTTVTEPSQMLSRLGAVIAKEKGPELDKFSLVFERIGAFENAIVEQVVNPVPVYKDATPGPKAGVRTFAQVNESMAAITGVDPNKATVRAVFDEVKTALPTTPDIESFVASHQTAASKLALEYCNDMVETAALRSAFFGNFEFGAATSQAFSNQAKKDTVVNALIDKAVGDNLTSQPDKALIAAELNGVINDLTANCNVAADCNAAKTRSVLKGACAAVLSSAVLMIQ